MDFTTFIGIIAAVGLIISGIGLPFLTNFFDLGSIFITVGGTFAVLFACYPIKTFAKVPSHFKILLGKQKQDPLLWIEKVTEYAQMARKSGLLVLEEKANAEKDEFFKSGILLIVDAVDADKAKAMLEGDLMQVNERHTESIGMYEKGASLGPAMGMIGTLIGLVNMLMAMSGESGGVESLGGDMSVALITTFYGSVLANVFFTPIANKLSVRNQEELLCKQIIIEGVLAIQAGENPKYINEKLLSLLPQKQRTGGGKKGKEKKEKAPKGAKA